MGSKEGQIRFLFVRNETIDKDEEVIIQAHENPISNLTLSEDGALVATASERGTLFNLQGSQVANIHSLSFNQTGDMLCCTSDRGTIHLFTRTEAREEEEQSLFVSITPSNNPDFQ